MDRGGFILQDGGGIVAAADEAGDPAARVDRAKQRLVDIRLAFHIYTESRIIRRGLAERFVAPFAGLLLLNAAGALPVVNDHHAPLQALSSVMSKEYS